MSTNVRIGEGRLGILGGMGSEATALFLQTLARRSRSTSDQHHVPFVLLSCPEIPDRSRAIEQGNPAVPAMIQMRLAQLEDIGCGAIAIACNTAHYWRGNFASALHVPMIDMVQATALHAARLGATKVIVLGTRSTMNLGLYDHALNDLNVQSIRVSDEIVDRTSVAIALAKSGNLDQAKEQLARVVDACRSVNSDTIILGCTELSMLAASDATAADFVDSEACLADACIRWWLARRGEDGDVGVSRSEESVNGA